MSVLIALALGLLVGFIPLCRSWHRHADKALTVLVAVIVFTMGVSLGQREDLWSQLSVLGMRSLVFAVVPMALSVLAVQLIARWLQGRKGAEK
jgi:uncharacterized membrane protein YbjE (DUF340 family)